MSLFIREAIPADAPAIKSIASEHVTTLQSLPKTGDNGFLTISLLKDEYARQIEFFTHTYVAEKDGRVAGYLLGSTVAGIARFYQGRKMPATMADIIEICEPDDIYVFQVAAGKKNQRQGILKSICNYLDTKVKGVRLLAHIVHEPVKNSASVAFFETQGYILNCELSYDGWTLGLYERRG